MLKKICLLVILIGAYAFIMINYPTDIMKKVGYNQVLDLYASAVSPYCSVNLVYDPGLRNIAVSPEQIQVQAVIPQEHNDYVRSAQSISKHGGAIVECSGMDAWHTTGTGRDYLTQFRKNTYRVVVMDGGHHLPTLGLAPDIIIVPAAGGYAVHARTLDGIKVGQITAIARKIKSDSVIAVVPRWALVKNQKSLEILTRRIIAASYYRENVQLFIPSCVSGVSQCNGIITAYVNKGYAADPQFMYKACRQLDLAKANSVYLAFDYSVINEAQAQKYTAKVESLCRKTVIRVNEPVKVSTVILRGTE